MISMRINQIFLDCHWFFLRIVSFDEQKGLMCIVGKSATLKFQILGREGWADKESRHHCRWGRHRSCRATSQGPDQSRRRSRWTATYRNCRRNCHPIVSLTKYCVPSTRPVNTPVSAPINSFTMTLHLLTDNGRNLKVPCLSVSWKTISKPGPSSQNSQLKSLFRRPLNWGLIFYSGATSRSNMLQGNSVLINF